MDDIANATKPAIAATKIAMMQALPADPIAASLEALSKQQIKLRKERKDLARQMKNAKKKVQRLKIRARQLTDDDLVAVLMMRKAAATAKAEPGAGMEGGSSSSTTPNSCGQLNSASAEMEAVVSEQHLDKMDAE